MKPADAEGAYAVLSAAFASMRTDRIVERELALGPQSSWIALADGLVVGLVCAVQYGVMAYIGPMGVTPGWQGRGVGRALMERLMAGLEQRGCTTMLLDATEAGAALYRKLGFVDSARTWDLQRAPGTGIATLPSQDGLEQALQFDRIVFAADRTRVFRRLLDGEGAAFYSRTGGYLIAQARLLGPFAAREPAIADELLHTALNAGAVAGRVLAPVENPFALRVLMGQGFTVTREVKQMRRGSTVPMRREWMYGLASFALG